VEDWKYFCKNGPRYKHDCSACKFLGEYYEYDLYWCPQSAANRPTVIARYGDEGWKYSSGMPDELHRVSFPDEPTVEAYYRAKARGYAMSREELDES
jgi:hypothetical protein